MNTKYKYGYSLLELMFTIGILGVTLAFAIPNMRSFLQSDTLTSYSNSLRGDLMYARNEARKSQQMAVFCSSSNGVSCTGSDFEDGWIVIVDTDNDGIVDQVKKVQQPIGRNISFYHTGLSTITYNSSGYLPLGSNTGTISICDTRTNPNDYAKTISISPIGRVSLGGNPACP